MRKYAKEAANDLFDPKKAPDFSEISIMSGSKELLEKSDAELFPDEIEAYTPKERRKGFKVHSKKQK